MRRGGSAETKPIKFEDAFEVSKQHLDLVCAVVVMLALARIVAILRAMRERPREWSEVSFWPAPSDSSGALRDRLPQSRLLARYSTVAPSFTRVPVVVSVLPPGQR